MELEEQDSIKRHFEYTWRELASINPNYRKFVEAEIARIGEDHITIRINSGRLKMYSQEEAPTEIYEEAWKQLKLARYTVPSEGVLLMHCNPSECHDDFLISIALCAEAIREFSAPVVEAQVIKPRKLYNDGRF